MIRLLSGAPRRILIVRLGAIGDVARVLPMLNGLRTRFPGAEIDWIVQAKAADLLIDHPQIDRLFVVPFTRWLDALRPPAWRLMRALQARRYELVLDFQGMAKGAVWGLAGARRAVRVGWGPGHTRNLTWLFCHGLRYPPGKRVNRHLRHRALVDWLDVPDVPAAPLSFAGADVDVVDRFFETISDRPKPWILAYPGSSVRGAHKRWDPDRLESALREVRERSGGTILVGWGPAEEAEAEALSSALGDAPCVPPTSIRQLAYLLSRCDLFVGMDTGPMHLSGLVGTPVVAIFGRSNPDVHGPAEHIAGRAVAAEGARHWPTRKRAGLEPFAGPAPDIVADTALEILHEHRRR